MTLYRTLGVRKNATADAIKKAYRRLAMRHHPDRNPGDAGADERFRAVQLAFDVLSDSERRAKYDATGDTSTVHASRELSELMTVLTPLLLGIVQQVIDKGGKIESEDMVGHMKTALTNAVKTLKDNRSKVVKTQTALMDSLERFAVDDGDNLLKSAAQFNLTQITNNLKAIDTEIAKIGRAVEYLKRCRYAHVQRLANFGMMNGGWASASATTTNGFWFGQ